MNIENYSSNKLYCYYYYVFFLLLFKPNGNSVKSVYARFDDLKNYFSHGIRYEHYEFGTLPLLWKGWAAGVGQRLNNHLLLLDSEFQTVKKPCLIPNSVQVFPIAWIWNNIRRCLEINEKLILYSWNSCNHTKLISNTIELTYSSRNLSIE